LWAAWQILISLLSCAFLVVPSYKEPHIAFEFIDIVTVIFVALDVILRLYVAEADQRQRTLFSFMTLIDIATIIPAFLLLVDTRAADSVEFLKALRIFRTLRAFDHAENATTKDLLEQNAFSAVAQFCVRLFGLIFVGAYLFQSIEAAFSPHQTIPFHNAIYFTVVTMSTVGYGDITPLSYMGKMYVSAFILFCIAVIPIQSTVIIEVLRRKPTPQSMKHEIDLNKMESVTIAESRIDRPYHVLVCGMIETPRFANFAVNLIDSYRAAGRSVRITLLAPQKRDAQMKVLLKHRAVTGCIRYIVGTPANRRDLADAGIADASSVLIVSPSIDNDNRHSSMSMLSESYIFCTAIRSELQSCDNPSCSITLFTEASEASTEAHAPAYFTALLGRCGGQLLISARDIHVRLLAACSVAPGVSTWLETVLAGTVFGHRLPTFMQLPGDHSMAWLLQYWKSSKCFFGLIPSQLHGEDFAVVARNAYDHNAVVLGVFRNGQFTGSHELWNGCLMPNDHTVVLCSQATDMEAVKAIFASRNVVAAKEGLVVSAKDVTRGSRSSRGHVLHDCISKLSISACDCRSQLQHNEGGSPHVGTLEDICGHIVIVGASTDVLRAVLPRVRSQSVPIVVVSSETSSPESFEDVFNIHWVADQRALDVLTLPMILQRTRATFAKTVLVCSAGESFAESLLFCGIVLDVVPANVQVVCLLSQVSSQWSTLSPDLRDVLSDSSYPLEIVEFINDQLHAACETFQGPLFHRLLPRFMSGNVCSPAPIVDLLLTMSVVESRWFNMVCSICNTVTRERLPVHLFDNAPAIPWKNVVLYYLQTCSGRVAVAAVVSHSSGFQCVITHPDPTFVVHPDDCALVL
jgi:voltage-gated potassium channel Kch